MHISRVLLFFFAGMWVIAAAGYSQARDLTLYIWDEYIADSILQDFEKKTGITVRQVYFDSDKNRDEIIASASGKQFDVILFDSISAQIFGKNNHLAAITESSIPNLANVDTRWQESCGNFGVPYFWGTVGLVYDKSRYPDSPPTSWLELLKPSPEHQGHVAMIEDLSDTLVPALIYLGFNINTENKEELRAAYELLREQVPYVLNYTYALTNVKLDDDKNRMDLALAYSGDEYALNEASGSEKWEYVIPKEGTSLWVDCLTINAVSQKRKEAELFLNFMLDAQVAAVNTEEVYNGTPISSTREYMSDEAKDDPELFLSPEVMAKTQMYRILSDNSLRQRARIVDTLLKRHEAQ